MSMLVDYFTAGDQSLKWNNQPKVTLGLLAMVVVGAMIIKLSLSLGTFLLET